MKNILIIHSDQHRYDCIGTYGNQDILTPYIDELAKEGTRYDNSFCCHPICSPSRYSMLTGVYPHTHGGIDNNTTILPEYRSLPQVLRDEGYRTSCVGKMHFRPTYLDIGFDKMILAEQNGDGRYDDDYHRMLKENNEIDKNDLIDQVAEYTEKADFNYWESMGAITSNLPEKYHSTTFIGNEACKILEDWDNSKNMMMVGFIKPHHPFDPPEPWSMMYEPNSLSLLRDWCEKVPDMDSAFMKFDYEHLDASLMKKVMSMYYGSISQIDAQVGKMIAILKEKGIYEDTLIVYTSDHGEYLGSHHLLLKCQNHYESLIRIPLIIKYPNGWHRGEVVDGLNSNVDLAPTLLNFLDIKVPKSMSGIDFNTTTNDYIFCAGEPLTIRSKRYKLMIKNNSKHLFFDLEEDPHEYTNYYHHPDYSTVVKKHLEKLMEWYIKERRQKLTVDDHATLSVTPNKRVGEEGERQKMKEYIKEKMNT